MRPTLLLTLCGLALAGCEQLGLDDPAKAAAARDAEGRAVGSGCRHSGRSLEDCYSINSKQSKAAIFGGWRDMDAYMRENNIEIVPSSKSAKKGSKALDEAAPTTGEAKKNGAAADLPALPKAGGKQA